jgi:hypothetical protein
MVKNHRGYILHKTADHEKGRKIEKIQNTGWSI